MLAIVTPAYLGYGCIGGKEGWCDAMDAQSAQRMKNFGTFLGNRYKAQGNIVWIAGDLYDWTAVDATHAASPLKGLNPPLGTFFVEGNHE